MRPPRRWHFDISVSSSFLHTVVPGQCPERRTGSRVARIDDLSARLVLRDARMGALLTMRLIGLVLA
ncbi:hypothetical protein CO669_30260 [Bradyrhizobium sp. Y36]|nr:hypothetical protein CO669_30260 [Bradyrhizobium sp. Y36]